jgi:hypothetical protein
MTVQGYIKLAISLIERGQYEDALIAFKFALKKLRERPLEY